MIYYVYICCPILFILRPFYTRIFMQKTATEIAIEREAEYRILQTRRKLMDLMGNSTYNQDTLNRLIQEMGIDTDNFWNSEYPPVDRDIPELRARLDELL